MPVEATHIVQYALDGGGTVFVEVTGAAPAGAQRVGRSDDMIEKANTTFQQAIGGIRGVADSLMEQLSRLNTQTEQVTAEFSFKFSGNAGIVLASSSVEGACKVTLTWKNKPPSSPG